MNTMNEITILGWLDRDLVAVTVDGGKETRIPTNILVEQYSMGTTVHFTNQQDYLYFARACTDWGYEEE